MVEKSLEFGQLDSLGHGRFSWWSASAS